MPMTKSFWGSSGRTRAYQRSDESSPAASQPGGSRLLKRVSCMVLPRRVQAGNSSTDSRGIGAVESNLHPSLLRSASTATAARLVKPGAISNVPESDHDQVVFASQLSKKYNIDHFETRRIVKSWEKFRHSPKYQRGKEQFGKFLGEIFDVEDVRPSVVENAFEASLRVNDNELSLDDFMAWYIRNMFTDVKNLNGRKSRLSKDRMDSLIGEECGVDAHTIRAIRKAFDTYDQDKSGEIDFGEFTAMIIKLMKANDGDVSASRLKQFWDEARGTDNDLSFYQFARWYAKYFYSEDKLNVVESMYESYNPSRIRSKQRQVDVKKDKQEAA
eukprot:TRINITY_DN30128_c0_g1_i2.p1 TRINITY_DN30128_c0_g1~~TRINITY_DN30128_c0_g1_i2.p1  ORF type:complete len:329 (-),score=44.67 TRINITY_DN30128_c0_g1_i2:82-1068(-)